MKKNYHKHQQTTLRKLFLLFILIFCGIILNYSFEDKTSLRVNSQKSVQYPNGITILEPISNQYVKGDFTIVGKAINSGQTVTIKLTNPKTNQLLLQDRTSVEDNNFKYTISLGETYQLINGQQLLLDISGTKILLNYSTSN